MHHTQPTHTAPLSGIDLTVPGGLDALFASMRARFGTATMSADAGDTGGGQQGDGQQQDDQGDADKPGDQQGDKGSQDNGNLPDDPAALKAEIARLRRENGDARVGAKTAAAEEARATLVTDLGKALGLIKDGSAQLKPEELQAQLTAAQTQQRETATELAVLRAAGKHSVDGDALLDSRTFLAKLAGLDPTDSGFVSKVADAVKKAGDDNPRLKVGRAPGASSADHAGGSGEKRTRTPLPLDQAVASSYAGR